MAATHRNRVCVLVSGGVDSSILTADLLRRGREVHPLYVQNGFNWEKAELFWLKRLLKALKSARLKPLTVISVPMAPLLDGHWSLTGRRVPSAKSPDPEVYLPGRNLILLGQAGIFCARRKIPRVALATLRSNPFSDATPRFRKLMEGAIGTALSWKVSVSAPYSRLAKERLAARVPGFPLELTFSCLKPKGLKHCGACNKCEERGRATSLFLRF